MKAVTISPHEVGHIASLTKVPLASEEEQRFAKAFNVTLAVVDKLFSIDISSVAETHQVTGLTNVFQEDEIDSGRMLTQEEALANAPRSHNGFFVVDQVIEQK
ncbi:Asp-tRNA(Asn)/Glu-tRNA(Gln) amidotransferase subunit GatC [Candidatus Gottesmanbacteria bacterium]|nr:Asp-tRNA(Asn)/Glu-tRNA(Gln) amidotransferase subunit GatC [Candidatus Gottesmanbacteria bacterium]